MEHGISDMYKTYLTVLLFSTSSAIKEHSSEGRVCILPLIWMQGGRDEEEMIPPPPPPRGKITFGLSFLLKAIWFLSS